MSNDPIHQFQISKLIPLDFNGLDLSFTNSSLFMVATVIALVASWALTRKLAMVPLVSAVFVAIFGALTLWLQSDLFIKVKVTLINAMFGAVLIGGAAFGKSYLKLIMGEAMKLPDYAWRILSIRWGAFFFAMAGLNEIVWRNFSTDTWVDFKVFGLLPLTLVFAVANAPYMAKHLIDDEAKT